MIPPTAVGIYISEDIKIVPRPELQLNMPLVESCWVEIDACNGKTHIIIGCIYRHPSANIEAFTAKLDELLKSFSHQNTKFTF